MKVDLEGKTALVTGAARGIGRAIADALASNGAEVFYTDVSFEETESPDGPTLELDVTSPESIDAVAARVRRDGGALHILVNNAGVNTIQYRVPLDSFPEAEWNRILDVDLTGLYRVSKAFAPLIPEHAGGRIINIASVAGLAPLRLQCAFVAAKAGVVNLTRAMALEFGPRGMTVNCIAPGSILTEGTRRLFYGEDGLFRHSAQALLDHIPLGRPGLPEEIAGAALFLAAPESSYVNGAVLAVDGGWTAGYLREF